MHNNAHIAEDFAICGSRGWYNDDKIASMPQNADYDKIVSEISMLLDNKEYYDTMSKAVNPYGDGLACSRIVESLK